MSDCLSLYLESLLDDFEADQVGIVADDAIPHKTPRRMPLTTKRLSGRSSSLTQSLSNGASLPVIPSRFREFSASVDEKFPLISTPETSTKDKVTANRALLDFVGDLHMVESPNQPEHPKLDRFFTTASPRSVLDDNRYPALSPRSARWSAKPSLVRQESDSALTIPKRPERLSTTAGTMAIEIQPL